MPQEARKKITGGKLNGMTDINPVWRLMRLTELFGPVGFGWNIREVDRWTNECAGEVAAFVKVELIICMDGTWSQPIEGTGGSKLCGKGHGDGINDEAWKMATTDAISVACKSLGMAADIYFEKGAYLGTKYEQPFTASRKTAPSVNILPPATAPSNAEYWAIVRAYGDGKPTKSGGDYRKTFIETYNPTPEMLDKFDLDVQDYKAAKQDGVIQ
ncbi:MAG: hypothetical protein J6T17_03910 [Clostridia bacterium]|nr:hypothetical protein [Clostridia bacterium]